MNAETSTNPALKRPPESNSAFAGVVQVDDPEILDPMGEQKASEEAKSNLASYVMSVFNANKEMRQTNGIDDDFAKRLRQMNGEYDPNDHSEIIAKGQPLCYINISAHKQRTLVAWLTEFFSDADKAYYLSPTPIPEMSPDIMDKAVKRTMQDWADMVAQTGEIPSEEAVAEYASNMREEIYNEIKEEAKQKAINMERRLKDDMIEGEWTEAVDELISLMATYGTAGFRSPVIRIKKAPAWDGSGDKQRVIDKIKLVREGEAISPWDMFPSNGARNAQEGDFCVRVRYTPKDLRAMRKVSGYDSDNIDRVLYMYGETGTKVRVSSDSERERLEKKDDSLIRANKMIEGVEFWGQASGRMLLGIGISRTADKQAIDEDEWYDVNAIVIEGNVIYCRMIDSSEERPIDVACVYKVAGSFWGQGPLQVIDHIQRLCNATARNLIVNMGFSAGPQALIDDVSRLHPMDDGKARPAKTWSFVNPSQSASKPISFFSIPSVSQELINIFQFYMRLADEITGIPAYANGTDAAVGAARTATGLNMLFGAANRGIKKIVANMDSVLKACVRRLYWWHMRYSNDQTIKGDVVIQVLGVKQFTAREMLAQKHLDLLRAIGQDQRMMQMQSPEQLAKMLREIATGFDLDPDSLAPTPEELEKRTQEAKERAEAEMAMNQEMLMAQQQQAMQEKQGDQQIEMAKVQQQQQRQQPQQPPRPV